MSETITKEQEESPSINPVKFPDKYSVMVIPTQKNPLYIFKDPYNNDVAEYSHDKPLAITEMSVVGKEIKKHLNADGRLTPIAVSRDFEDIKQILNEYYQAQILQEDRQKEENALADEILLKEKIVEAQEILENKKHPLIYIGSLVSWLTAGERTNIMLTFIAYASQIILRNPISVIGLGEGGSGKTHIQEVAMGLIPDDFIRHEKSITEAAMFNRAKENPYYYDGCIVNYGDLGGRNSQDFILEAKNLLKELQSDGFLNKPLNIPSNKGWEVIDIKLLGRPALTYTTVPGFEFDDQEMSRSIFITPRMDNKKIFNARKQIMELKHGKTYREYIHYQKETEIVKYMIHLLRAKMDELTIINPYTESIIKFLGESEYFKRDFDKYNGILKTITAFNCFNRQVFDLDGQNVLFTTLDDIKLFMSLLKRYHESISVNISPKAAEVLGELRDRLEDWILERKVSELGITINEYFELSKLNLSKRSMQSYFGELNRTGFIRAVGKEANSNIYCLSGYVEADVYNELLQITELESSLVRWELGEVALNFIKEDAPTDGLSIDLHYPDVDVPDWVRYDE